jgi:DNA-binding ferritin-like protein
VIRQGAASVTRRLKELVGDSKPAGHLVELWREGAARLDTDVAASGVSAAEARSRSLLAAYRAACRPLCASLQEARRSADGATAVMLSSLLQRLEKQLWLLDSSPECVQVGLPTIDLFLSY